MTQLTTGQIKERNRALRAARIAAERGTELQPGFSQIALQSAFEIARLENDRAAAEVIAKRLYPNAAGLNTDLEPFV